MSVGLEILGRLLYCTYDKDSKSFDAEKVSEMAQLDWSRSSDLWEGNVVLSSPNPTNPAKPYKISAGANSVRIAVSKAKANLGW
jgi:DNA sulfur modification protein DndB